MLNVCKALKKSKPQQSIISRCLKAVPSSNAFSWMQTERPHQPPPLKTKKVTPSRDIALFFIVVPGWWHP